MYMYLSLKDFFKQLTYMPDMYRFMQYACKYGKQYLKLYSDRYN